MIEENIMSPELDFFRSQSPITEPGANAALFNALPDDLPGIAHAVQGLVYHYVADEQLYHWPVPPARLPEIDTRMVEAMLARITTLDDRPLTATRPPPQRLIGCCRDFTALFVAALRHKGIAARSRHGFATYFVPGYFIDHVIAEVWEDDRRRWRMFDPELPPERFPEFDVTDITRDQFVLGGDAWQRCRAGESEPARFGLGPDVPVHGWNFIASRILQDLAALNKREMLCWEDWGLALTPYAEMAADDLALLDQVAAVTTVDPVPFEQMRSLYQHDARLNLTGQIMTFSPAYPEATLPRAVRLPFDG
jgi:hypothetical protein